MRSCAPLLCLVFVGPAFAEDKIVFNRDIRPLLSDNCFACHGPDEKQRKAKLRLDVRANAVEHGAIVPGKNSESELVSRVFSTDRELVMPPPESNKRLTTAQKDLLKKWIAQGAPYQGHWAYEPPVKPAIPAGANAIDHLIGLQLAANGLPPAPEADRRTLARRLSFDLLGLPPKSEEVEAFVADKSPEAYGKYVEKLLASPHYGERMAMTWLDWVRFADTIGYHSDTPRNVWPFRDYVIRSFNTNKQFDRFTVEQLAGDLLPNPTQETKVASAFNRLLLTTEEGGAQAKDYEARMLGDRVRAVGTVWLGQTIGCAQCHDHKFDPIKARDFYSLGAFFADIQEPIIGGREPGMPVVDDAQTKELARLKELEASTKNATGLIGKLTASVVKKVVTDYEYQLPKCLVSVSMANPRTVRILPRGNWLDDSGTVVTPAFPAFLTKSAPPDGRRLNRLDLANWIVARENPLTARVFVNRLWKQFFGVALSKATDDLGSQGDWPTNPELLDWLAVEFIDRGWDVKQMIRTIVTSRAYKMASVPSPEALAKDPDNRLLSRQNRFRMDAEFVRDNALSVSGLLTPTIGGPSVRPYQPDGYWENLNFPVRQYYADKGEDQYRRGLYSWWQRSFLHPSLLAFDAPTREECAADRTRSNIPQQALVLLNDPSYVEASRAFAVRILKQGGADTATRVKWAYRQALQREPRLEELKVVSALVEKHRKEYVADKPATTALLKVGFAPPPTDMDAAELAAWSNAARVLLNLHESITRN